MTDFPAEPGNLTAGQAMTERSGAAVSTDTVPAGAIIVARNTGAGSHTVVLVSNATFDGLAIPGRTHTIPAGGIRTFKVHPQFGDANGRVGISIGEGTQSEVKYYVLGALG